jgi:two-component system sensor histidine kinase SenX3
MWLAGLLGCAIGAAVGVLALARRNRRQTIARTLVPHRTRQLVGALQSGAIVVRRDRRAAFSNGAAAALGVARPDGALHPGVADLAEQAWRRGEPVEDEIEVRRGVLGAVSRVHVRATVLDEELVLAVANDNTEARAAEQNRREFAINVSHELKTPVGALALLAESLQHGADDPEMVQQFAGKIRKESRRLTKLIQEIIEISRLQAGESVADFREIDLGTVVDEAIDEARIGAETRRIALVPDIKSRPTVMGDHDLLVMALRNLIDNAVNYSDPGAKVTVGCATNDGVATVSVIDQGMGIAKADLERVFERFYRTDPARSRETGGTGLGLSIVKHVALQHAGSVDVWSKPDVGSTFSLRIQVHQEAS